jgi:hypothetical protein
MGEGLLQVMESAMKIRDGRGPPRETNKKLYTCQSSTNKVLQTRNNMGLSKQQESLN